MGGDQDTILIFSNKSIEKNFTDAIFFTPCFRSVADFVRPFFSQVFSSAADSISGGEKSFASIFEYYRHYSEEAAVNGCHLSIKLNECYVSS